MPEPSKRGRRALGVARLVAALLTVAACGDPSTAGDDSTTAGGDPADTDRSAPFTVGHIPAGYDPVNAGIGNATPDWGADSTGTHEPFTVLAPTGSSDPAERVVVSITGFEGYQNSLDQTLYDHGSYFGEQLTIEGRDARYLPADGARPAVLVAVRGDDLAVRVVAPDATLERLKEILAAVEVPADRTRAPAVPTPPAGLEVVGSVDVDAVLALTFGVEANTDRLRALDSTHVAGWLNGPPAIDEGGSIPRELAVLTLPGRAADREVLPTFEMWLSYRNWRWENVDVAGDPGMVIEVTEADNTVWKQRSVWRWTDRGDIVVVTAQGYKEEPLTVDELVAVAESVEGASAEEWEQFVVEMTGGAGLRPDPGRAEIARGEHDGLEWLLQTAPQGAGQSYGSGIDPAVIDAVDPCLKLSNRRRACVPMSGSVHDWIGTGEGLSLFDDLVIISTTREAALVHIATPSAETQVPLVQVPHSPARAAVAFIDQPGFAGCVEDFPMEPPAHLTIMRVEALDATGEVIACLGLGSQVEESGS